MRNPEQEALQAILRSDIAPNAEQEKRFIGFLQRKYEREISLVWEEDKTLRGGFRLQVGSDVYDWSVEGRLRQLRERLERLKADRASVIPLMREAVADWNPTVSAEETGTVLSVGDEIAVVSGLEHATYGEILLFSSGVKGMVQELRATKSAASCLATTPRSARAVSCAAPAKSPVFRWATTFSDAW